MNREAIKSACSKPDSQIFQAITMFGYSITYIYRKPTGNVSHNVLTITGKDC